MSGRERERAGPLDRRIVVRASEGDATAVDLCARAAERAGGPSARDPLESLLAIARTGGSEGERLVVRVEDARALDPLETGRLRNLAAAAEGRLAFELPGSCLASADPARRAEHRPAAEAPGGSRVLATVGVAAAAGTAVLAALALAAFALGLGHASAPVRAHPDVRLRPPPARIASALPSASRAPAVPPPEVEIGINASPWAHVEMDGRALGTTPLGGVRVPAGLHVFRARMADGRWLERRIVIGPGEHTLVFR